MNHGIFDAQLQLCRWPFRRGKLFPLRQRRSASTGVDVHGAVLVVDGCSVGGPQHLGMTWIRFTPGIVGWWMLVLSPTSHGIIYGKFMDLSADPGRQQGGARQGREVVNTKNIHNNNSSNSNPPTPADARGSALGNNTFDPGFGLVPLLYSIG